MRTTLLAALFAVAAFAAAAADRPVITVVYHDTGIEFGQVIRTGVLQAGRDFDVRVEFVGPIGIKVDEQVAIIENAITKKVDGLAVSNVNGEALNPMLDKAIAAGIPTVTFNSDAAGSKRAAFYGQDLVKSGEVQAENLVKHMGDKGRILIITGEAAASWSQDREQGVRNVIAKHPGIEIVNLVSTGWEEQAQYAAIENALLANPDLTGIASLDAATTPATGRALLRMGRTGKVKHVGHDLVPETLDNIASGATNAALSQNPFMQGYLPVQGLAEYLKSGKPLVSSDTGILLVDDTNVQEYLQKLEAGEPIG